MSEATNADRPLPVLSSEGLGAVSEARCFCRVCMKARGDGQTFAGLFWPQEMLQMTLCLTCGNKRCPHANNHRHACTNSNDTGQPGSAYE